jgi:predicted permease
MIACTNVAGMLLARGAARSREVAVRASLGASRGRLVRQHLVEGTLLAASGAVIGVLGAVWLIAAIERLLLPVLPTPMAVLLRVDWRVVTFSAVLALVVGVLSGIVPASQTVRLDVASTLKDAWADSRRSMRLRSAFVFAQTAAVVALLVCALLFARSVGGAARLDPGFRVDNVDTVALDVRLAGYTGQPARDFSERLLARVTTLPGVQSAAFARVLPLTGSGMSLGTLGLPGGAPGDVDSTVDPDWNIVSPGYFDTMGIALVAGRDFSSADSTSAPLVAVVNETLAAEAWPGRNPIGQILIPARAPDEPARQLQVVGVARDGKYRTLADTSRPFIYVPFSQHEAPDLTLLVQHDAPVMPAVLATIQDMDAQLPVVRVESLAQATSLSLLPSRLAAWIATAASAIGLLLTALGIYGITAYTVTLRTRELGLRMALGALRRDVLALVIGRAMRLTGAGVLTGLAAAALATQFLRVLLYVDPLDPVSFATAGLTLCGLALVAAAVPAARAARMNPLDTLRNQ